MLTGIDGPPSAQVLDWKLGVGGGALSTETIPNTQLLARVLLSCFSHV